MPTQTRTKRLATAEPVTAPADQRDQDPLFDTYMQQWQREVDATPALAALPPHTRVLITRALSRSSVRFDRNER